MSQRNDIDWIFYPWSVAFVGIAPELENPTAALLLQPLLRLGYQGKIYLVHPRAISTSGFEAHSSIDDITGEIDYVIASIPASSIPGLIKDCAAKGVKVISFFTSGFSETGDEQGINLEKEILELARQNGLRLIGPNCLGLYTPKIGLGFGFAPPQSGTVGLLSQSGGAASIIIEEGANRGIYFSKAVSYGNACDLDESDFLEYFTNDPETKVIAAYIEGVKDGSRFLKLLKKAAQKKPIIAVKGGRTESGTRAALSHTGAIAGTWAVWESIFKQTGAVLASDLDELADLLVAFVLLHPPNGKRVGLNGVTGGGETLSADICESRGLSVPQYSRELQKNLSEFGSGPGTSIRNPIDNWPLFGLGSQQKISEAIKLIMSSNEVDLLIFGYFAPIYHTPLIRLGGQAEGIIQAVKEGTKPIAVTLPPPSFPTDGEAYFTLRQKYLEARVPVFPSVSRAASAISKFIDYQVYRQA